MAWKLYVLKETQAMADNREGDDKEYIHLFRNGAWDTVNSIEWLSSRGVIDLSEPDSLFFSLREAKRTRAKFFKRGTVNWPDIVKIEETVVG